MIPERSLAGKAAKSIFFTDVNDIDIYVEDTEYGYEKLFSVVFSRVFEGSYKVKKVFPLGGRAAVLQHHQSFGGSDRPTLHVIDGDLFLLSGDSAESGIGLYITPFYCIENLLCDPFALCEFAHEEDAISLLDQLERDLDFDGWIEANIECLFDLFVEYAITFKINQDQQTVAYSVKNLVSDGNGLVDKQKVNDRIETLKAESKRVAGDDVYVSTRSDVLSRFSHSGLRKMDVISGKDYLFPLLKMRCKSVVKTKVPDINIKIRVALKCNLDVLRNSQSFVRC